MAGRIPRWGNAAKRWAPIHVPLPNGHPQRSGLINTSVAGTSSGPTWSDDTSRIVKSREARKGARSRKIPGFKALPGFFPDWNSAGTSPHIRYHRPDGSTVDSPNNDPPFHPIIGASIWVKPEPMHALEVWKDHEGSNSPPLHRDEINEAP